MHRLTIAIVVVAAFVVGSFLPTTPTGASWVRPQTILAQNDCQTFPETGQTVCGIFLSYWRANGGLAQQGYPISDVIREKSTDGNEYDTQYFERAIFEHHRENAGTKYEVLLRLVGRQMWDAKYPGGLPSGSTPLQVGQSLILYGNKKEVTFRARIDGVQETTTLPEAYGGTDTQQAKGKFVVVLLNVQNIGKESGSINGPLLRVQDNQARFFDVADTEVQRGAEELTNRPVYYETIQPGITSDIVIVFDVAADAGDMKLVPRESQF